MSSGPCPSCGQPTDLAAKFCGQCGQPLPAAAAAGTPAPAPVRLEGERKQLTVLVADVKGSMNLQADLDPEEWAGIMDRYVRLLADGVHRFGGTVDRFTGDGIMALFGAPLALEDHARRACMAALALSQSIADYADELRRSGGPEFLVRIGLSSGEAVVGRVGDDLQLDPTALGFAVGLAQRMEGMAEPGHAYLTQYTARLVGDAFHLTDLGLRTVEGAHEPIGVFALDGAAWQSTVRATTPLVGRGTELATLDDAFALAAAGSAQIVGVMGEAGVGKSRLCDEFVSGLVTRGVTVHRTGGVSHGRDLPLLPILALLRDYFDIVETDTPATVRAKVERRLLDLDPALAEDLLLFYDFLEVADPAQPAPKLAADVRMRRLFAALRRVTGRRSARELLVLFVEDLHWFDPQSEAFLQQLMESFAETRTLVLTTFRPEFTAAWTGLPYYRQISLARLRTDAVGELLGGLLGVDLSLAPLVAFVSERTGGNPFFVEEVVRALLEDGTLAGAPGAYRLTRPLHELRVPPSVHAVLAARIDRLPPDHKALLQTAAVIGRTFSQPVLARVAGVGAGGGAGNDALVDALRALCAAELLQAVREYPAPEFRFWHPLTQEVAYATLLARDRAGLHARVAEALAAHGADSLDERSAELAWHWEQAGNGLEAARWNLRAAGYALRSDLGEAMRRWQATVDLLEGLDGSGDSLTMGVQARIRLLQFGGRVGIGPDAARRLYDAAHEGAVQLGHVGMQGLVDLAAGSAAVLSGDVVRGLQHYEESARLGELIDDRGWKATLALPAPVALTYIGPLPLALTLNAHVIAVCDGDVECGVAVLGYGVLGRALQIRASLLARTGRLAEAREVLDQSIAMARLRGDSDTLWWALPLVTRLGLLVGGDVDREPAAEAVRGSEDTGNMPGLVLGLESVALAHLAAGRPGEAAAACQRALDESRRQGSGLFEEALVLGVLARSLVALGQADAALVAADQAVDLARGKGLRVAEVQVLLDRADVGHEAGRRPELLLADLDAADALVQRVGAVTYEPFLLEARSRVEGDDRHLAEAARLYAEVGADGHVSRLKAVRPAR